MERSPVSLRTLQFSLCLLAFSTMRASADVMEGDHLLLIGAGRGAAFGSLGGVRGYDFDQDGTPDDVSVKSGLANNYTNTGILAQYFYHWSPTWAFGFSYEHLTLKAGKGWKLPPSSLSGGGSPGNDFIGEVHASGFTDEYIPMVRYTMQTYKRINPYLTGGVGLNYFATSTNMSYGAAGTGGPFNNIPTSSNNTFLYNTRSIGIVATLGGGAQFMMHEHILAGVDVRWTISQNYAKESGNSIWSRVGGSLWIGTKWNAPL